ncbi:MAG: L-threonylcarbamoyladenylate synthase [Bacteroidia bacterium]
MSKIGTDLLVAKEFLQKSGVVAIPTETVYGLAANAFDEGAVVKVFRIKNRPKFDPLIVHTDSIEKISQFAILENPQLIKLANKFWPGPLTLLLPRKEIIPDLVTSGLPNIAVRIPNHPLTLALLSELNFPLAAPSANPFGYVSPTQAKHVAKQLGEKVNYILDGGECNVGIESTIVGVENGKPTIYRLGGLSVEEIENEVGKVNLQIKNSDNPKAPGQLTSHYAPGKPLYVGELDELISKHSSKRKAIVKYGTNETRKSEGDIEFQLSEKGDVNEAAKNLFRVLREIDETDVEIILAPVLPEIGLGKAINDRLKRASVPNS